MLRRFLALMVGLLSFGWLNVNTPKPVPPVVRFSSHPFVKRGHAKMLGIGALARSLFSKLWNALATVPGYSPSLQRAGILNLFLDPLPTFPYDLAIRKNDLPQNVFIKDLLVRITGTLTVSGGTTDGTLLSEPIARLIRSLRVRWDSFDLVAPMGARDLAALGRRVITQPLSGTPITIPGVQTTNFELKFFIPFARDYNANPFDTVLPPLNVQKELVVEIEWESATSNSVVGTTPGSGAIVSGGDRVVALTNTQATVLPRQARNGAPPWYLPVLSVYESRTFDAANARLPLDIRQQNAFDGVLFRFLQGATRAPAALLNTLSFETDNVKVFEQVPASDLRAIEEDYLGGVIASAEVGNYFVQFSDGGKLVNIVNPSELSLPKFEFDVSTPGATPAVVRAIVCELKSVRGVTLR